MSRRQLLPSLLAISCLLSSEIQAKEKGSAAVSVGTKTRSNSVPKPKKAETAKSNIIGDFVKNNKNSLYSGLLGFATGGAIGTRWILVWR